MMATYISIHYAHKIRAEAGTTTGAPLIVKADRDNGGVLSDEVTLFTDDHDLTRLLADAINTAVAARNAAKAEREAT